MPVDSFTERYNLDIPASAVIIQDGVDDQVIGQGGFASVYKAKLSSSGSVPSQIKSWIGKDLAFKKFRTTSLCKSAKLRLQREVAMGRYLAHPHVVATLGAVIAPKCNGVLMHAAEASLQDVVEQHAETEKQRLQEGRPVDARAQKSFHYKIACAMLQVAQALESLHAKGVIHCDVKPANILIALDGATDRLQAKLGDLGSCQLVDNVKASTPMSVLSGTVHYQAPESLSIPPSVLEKYKATTLQHTQVSAASLRAHISARTDVWAFGISLLQVLNQGVNPVTQLFKADDELFLAMLPYNNRAQTRPHQRVPETGGLSEGFSLSITSNCPELFLKLAQRCLIISPADRASMGQVLSEMRLIVAQLQRDLAGPAPAPIYRDVHVHVTPTRADRAMESEPIADVAAALQGQCRWEFAAMEAALSAMRAQPMDDGEEDDQAYHARSLLERVPAARHVDLRGVTDTGRIYNSRGALNGRSVLRGPRGGEFVINDRGVKVYVKDRETQARVVRESPSKILASKIAAPAAVPKPAPQVITRRVEVPATPERTHTATGSIYTSSGSANGRALYEGTRGGTYYLTENNNKRYVAPAPAPTPSYSAPVQTYSSPSSRSSSSRHVPSGQTYSSSGSANGRQMYTGARGGSYYLSASGNKVYPKK